MENTAIQKKQYKKLGFTYLDTAEIVTSLKKTMANYQMLYFKLRNFHWNVEGPDFFELHEEFENDYNRIKVNIDDIAERIRVFGLKPGMNMSDVIEQSDIKEPKTKMSAMDMVRELIHDYETVHDSLLDSLNASLETGDSATEYMINKMIKRLEKRYWMYTSWCK